jgi:hypothetical protein
MGFFGSTRDLELQPAEILMRVPHLQTETKLVLGKATDTWGRTHFIAWEGWNGRKAIANKELRWVRFFDSYDAAEAEFYAQLEEGPKRFKEAKKRDYQSGRIWRWWCEQVSPKAQPATMREVQTVVMKLRKEHSKQRPVVFVQGKGGKNSFKGRKNVQNGVGEIVMHVQARPTIPRVLLDTLWPLHGHSYSPALVLALMDGLVRFAKYDRGEVRAQVRRYRIKVAKRKRSA